MKTRCIKNILIGTELVTTGLIGPEISQRIHIGKGLIKYGSSIRSFSCLNPLFSPSGSDSNSSKKLSDTISDESENLPDAIPYSPEKLPMKEFRERYSSKNYISPISADSPADPNNVRPDKVYLDRTEDLKLFCKTREDLDRYFETKRAIIEKDNARFIEDGKLRKYDSEFIEMAEENAFVKNVKLSRQEQNLILSLKYNESAQNDESSQNTPLVQNADSPQSEDSDQSTIKPLSRVGDESGNVSEDEDVSMDDDVSKDEYVSKSEDVSMSDDVSKDDNISKSEYISKNEDISMGGAQSEDRTNFRQDSSDIMQTEFDSSDYYEDF